MIKLKISDGDIVVDDLGEPQGNPKGRGKWESKRIRGENGKRDDRSKGQSDARRAMS